MSESECIDFLIEQGVDFPDDYEDISKWGPFIKKTISAIETNPYVEFHINYSVTAQFAEAIRDAVLEYYSLPQSYSAARTSVLGETKEALEHSTTYCSWNSTYSSYNCYVFALDEVDVEKRNPGYYSGQSFSLSLSIDEIAELVIDDLQSRGNVRVTDDREAFDFNNLCTNEKIICVRRGVEDYHFTKLSGSSWYHKPSTTLPLRYKYFPTTIQIWNNERVVGTTILKETTVYDSDIVFISYNGHNWTYTSHNTGTHTVYCTICGDFKSEVCDIEYVSSGASGHYEQCSLCGYTSVLGNHNKVCSYIGNGTAHIHADICSACNYVYAAANCNMEYHYSHTENGINYHHNICTVCGNEASAPTQCVYKGADNACLVCGWLKGATPAAAQEEDEEEILDSEEASEIVENTDLDRS